MGREKEVSVGVALPERDRALVWLQWRDLVIWGRRVKVLECHVI